ncbi:MAG: hypothetical protein NE334_09825 [Lentisphaeraceae bacterium]|nr:hypothetical protein [Lentisphaeraceae bacterium]
MKSTDLSPIPRLLGDMYGSFVFIASCCHLNFLDVLDSSPKLYESIKSELGLADRPMMVILPVLSSMGLVKISSEKSVSLTEMGFGLKKNSQPHLWDYVNLEASEPGVLEIVDLLKNDGVDSEEGIAYCKEEEGASPMDNPELAEFLTKALAGRAEMLAPIAASEISPGEHLLDIAGGSGFFTFEWLRLNPTSSATLLDCPAVLDVSRKYLEYFSKKYSDETIASRVNFLPGNMMTDDLPKADIVLTASIFHDWPEETCLRLVKKFSEVINEGGEFWIHDAFLNDDFSGPKCVADYSAKLFKVTKGRCYSREEHFTWLSKAGLRPGRKVDTALDYSLISALK